MRRITERGACPPHLERQEIEPHLAKVFSAAGDINTDAIESKVYRGPADSTEPDPTITLIVKEFRKRYFGKCAYCESADTIEVEHYRPKKAVRGVKKHRGYYWLCYEWTNLLPSCHDCNELIHGKGTQFPLLKEPNRRRAPLPDPAGGLLDWSANVIDSAYLKAEAPVLLHPEHDCPAQCLAFDIEPDTQRVTMFGTDVLKRGAKTVSRGEETIKICNLTRDSLLTNRTKDVILHAQVLIDLLMAAALLKGLAADALLPIAFQQLDTEAGDEKLTYTMLRQYLVSTPNRFIRLMVNRFPASDVDLVTTAFKNYRAVHPSPYTFAGI